MDPLSIAVGAVGVGLVWFATLAARKGLPAAWAWLKAKCKSTLADDLTALKAESEQLLKDLTSLRLQVSTLEARLASIAPAPVAPLAVPGAV